MRSINTDEEKIFKILLPRLHTFTLIFTFYIILFTTLKDNHLQLINGDKRKDDERKNE